MYILDTSAFIHLAKETDIGRKIRESYGEEIVRITTFTVHELLVGALSSTKKQLYEDLFPLLEILPFGYDAATHSAELERLLRTRGRLINKVDILIAGICLTYGATIVTCDADFTKIPGLQVVFVG